MGPLLEAVHEGQQLRHDPPLHLAVGLLPLGRDGVKLVDEDDGGEFFSASSKAFLRLLSDSPAILDMISGPLIRKKKAPVSFATALAIKVLPVPEDENIENIDTSVLSQI